MRLGQKPTDLVLCMVGVLVLVDQDVAETLLIGREHLGMVFQQEVRVEQQVVEIERVRRTQTLLQAAIDASGHLPHRIDRLVGEHVRTLQLIFRHRDAVAQRIERKALRIDVELGHDFLHEALRVSIVVDGEVLREAEDLGVGAQHAHAHAMERRHPHATRARPHERNEALAHLGGRLIRERDGKNFPRRSVGRLEDVRNAIGQHAGLARPGTCEHEKRPVNAFDSLSLRVIQSCQI